MKGSIRMKLSDFEKIDVENIYNIINIIAKRFQTDRWIYKIHFHIIEHVSNIQVVIVLCRYQEQARNIRHTSLRPLEFHFVTDYGSRNMVDLPRVGIYVWFMLRLICTWIYRLVDESEKLCIFLLSWNDERYVFREAWIYH